MRNSLKSISNWVCYERRKTRQKRKQNLLNYGEKVHLKSWMRKKRIKKFYNKLFLFREQSGLFDVGKIEAFLDENSDFLEDYIRR